MTANPEEIREKTCLVTGTGGYLGSRLKVTLQQRGWRIIALTRDKLGEDAISYQLGDELEPKLLKGANALVHCAYDFSKSSRLDIHRSNVAGSEKLFRTAKAAGVGKMVYISSISAFEGTRSLYGHAKLETEKIAQDFDAFILRPGLIWGDPPGGPFGRLVAQIEGASLLPLFGGGRQIQFPVFDQDLVRFICDCVEGKIPTRGQPITVANEQPWAFRDLLLEITKAKRKRIFFVPVPWRLGWAALKLAELAGLRLPFRSDNLLSLMHQNPNPSFVLQHELGIVCRPFAFHPAVS
jgi:nucleoside-diphosphate-sugar epimerase